jgi:hypothetical protein
MRAAWPFAGTWARAIFAVVLWCGLLLSAGVARPESCPLPSHHVGLAFPLERIGPEWACRIKPIVDGHTTADKVGPLRAALSESLYVYLLDRPPLAAALINRLDLAPYKAEQRGPGRYWGDDGDGTEGIVELIYHDRTSRVYYLEGTHHSRWLPHLRGRAVVLLRATPVTDPDGLESMDSTMVSYTKLDNAFLAGLASLLRPLVGSAVTHRLAKGVEVVNRLGLEMRRHPDRVLFEAMDPPALPTDDVVFLREALAGLHLSGHARPQGASGR